MSGLVKLRGKQRALRGIRQMKRTLLGSVALAAAALSSQAYAQTAEQVFLNADFIEESDEGNLITATGSVEASYGGRVLKADRVIYDKRTGKVRATGNVSISDVDGTVRFADEIEVTEALDDGYAVGFSTRLPEGGVASATSAVRRADGISALDQAIYTACEVCEENGSRPTWALRARRAVLNPNSDIVSYRDAVLEIAGVPVLYIPYFFHPDPSAGRRSGLLVPNIGGNNRLGFAYGQPYHWVISPSSDATITPRIFSSVRPLLEAEYRKRFWSGELSVEGSVTFEQDFDNDGVRFGDEEIRGHVFADGDFKINDVWSWGFGVERASDDLFLRRYSIDGAQFDRGLYQAQPRTLLSQLYATGQTDTFYADASFLFFQDLRASTETVTDDPITTPLAFAEKLFDFGKFGRFNLTASSAVLNRNPDDAATPDINPDSRRVSIGADWSTTRVLPGGFVVEPFADVRGDYYDLDPLASDDNTVVRGVGSAGAKLSWPLARQGEVVDIVVEPTILGAWGVASANDTAIPIEDSLLFEFDETRLFESNGFGNVDLYEGDGRLSVGISSQARFKSGASINLIAGRRWRSEADAAFDAASNLDGTSSDWLGAISGDFGRRLRLEARIRLDAQTYEVNRIDASAATSFWRINASARYFRIDEDIRVSETGTPFTVPDEGLQFNTGFQLTDRFSVSYGQLTDLTARTNLRRSIGVAYSDDCSRFEFVFSRSEFEDRTIGANNSFRFRFTLATIGEFGGDNSQNNR